MAADAKQAPLQRFGDVRSIAFFLSHSSAGGAQEIMANLAGSFRDRGYEVSLVAFYPDRKEVREPPHGLAWRYIAGERPRTPAQQVAFLGLLRAYFRDDSPDYCFTAMPAANVFAPMAARSVGSRTRFAISHHSPVNTYNRFLDIADARMGGSANIEAIICVSNAVAASVERRSEAYRTKRAVIHNAVPPNIDELLGRLAAQRLSKPPGRVVVATGRLAPQKNYPVLIRAMCMMPDVRVRIVGAGPEEESLRTLAKELGVEDRLELLGHKPREEALGILAEGDIFTQPSLFEGHSLGLIEAAKLAMPLVVSSVPVQMEGITAADGSVCGMAVEPHDHEGLAKAILSLLDAPDTYADYAARAAALARTATYSRMMDRYENLLQPRL